MRCSFLCSLLLPLNSLINSAKLLHVKMISTSIKTVLRALHTCSQHTRITSLASTPLTELNLGATQNTTDDTQQNKTNKKHRVKTGCCRSTLFVSYINQENVFCAGGIRWNVWADALFQLHLINT